MKLLILLLLALAVHSSRVNTTKFFQDKLGHNPGY